MLDDLFMFDAGKWMPDRPEAVPDNRWLPVELLWAGSGCRRTFANLLIVVRRIIRRQPPVRAAAGR